MRQNPFSKLIFASVLGILAVGVLSWFFWRASLDVLSSVDTLFFIESRIATLENDRKIVLASADTLARHAPDLEIIGLFLIDRERPVEFIESLENLAKSTGSEIAIDVVPLEKGTLLDVLRFRLTVEGERGKVLKYLKLLEFMPYEISVEDLAYQSGIPGEETGPTETRLIISIKVKTNA
jgi:hypothetical protein